MRIVRAICACGFHTRKARAGYHFHQWWFPVLDTSTGHLTDHSRSLPEELVDLIQLGKACADELHRPFTESVTQQLLRKYADRPDTAFNPDSGTMFACPKCRGGTLRVEQVKVTAICKGDCGHKYQWRDSEQHGCPRCSYRPHRFSADAEPIFRGEARTESFCPCSSSMDSASPDDAYCPKCGQLPRSYRTKGLALCGIHHEAMRPYRVPGNFLFIEPPSRWALDRFPNAKLWGDADSDDSAVTWYCPSCELEHQRWLATEG
jgi:hypothetical protein